MRAGSFLCKDTFDSVAKAATNERMSNQLLLGFTVEVNILKTQHVLLTAFSQSVTVPGWAVFFFFFLTV